MQTALLFLFFMITRNTVSVYLYTNSFSFARKDRAGRRTVDAAPRQNPLCVLRASAVEKGKGNQKSGFSPKKRAFPASFIWPFSISGKKCNLLWGCSEGCRVRELSGVFFQQA